MTDSGWPDPATAVYSFLDHVDLAMAQEGLSAEVRSRVISRLIYGDRLPAGGNQEAR